MDLSESVRRIGVEPNGVRSKLRLHEIPHTPSDRPFRLVTRLRKNIIANFGGQATTVLIGILFIPFYVRILGVEAYGLIGFYLSLQTFFTVLDMGLSATLNREFARHSFSDNAPDRRRDLLRTLEWIYWPVGVLIAIAVSSASLPIAVHWLNPEKLDAMQTARAISLMGLATALQWPISLYDGGFRGLERQVALNSMSAMFALLRSLGALFVLACLSPTLEAFLWWQVIAGVTQTTFYRYALWRMLPPTGDTPRFNMDLVRHVRQFTLGITGISILSFALTQSDRLILSKIIPLTDLGYYTIACTVAGALTAIAGSFFNALFPRYSALVSSGDEHTLIHLYHESSQYIAIAVASVASVLAFFATDILTIWTHNIALARNSGPILSILAVGTALNGLGCLPYALQLAHGWTRLTIYQNIVAVLVVVPTTWWAANHYGGVGAASVWIGLNVGYLTVGIPLMHRHLLRNEMVRWYRTDIIPPVLAAIATAAIAKASLGSIPFGLGGIARLGLVGLLVLCSTALFSTYARQGIANKMAFRLPWN